MRQLPPLPSRFTTPPAHTGYKAPVGVLFFGGVFIVWGAGHVLGGQAGHFQIERIIVTHIWLKFRTCQKSLICRNLDKLPYTLNGHGLALAIQIAKIFKQLNFFLILVNFIRHSFRSQVKTC